MNENSITRTFSFIAAFLSLLLPITQLGIILTDQNPLLFLDVNAIIPTSIITLIISVLVIFINQSFPHLRHPLNAKHEQKYLNYLRKTNPKFITPEEANKVEVITPPAYITHDLLLIIALFFAVLTGYVFVTIGLSIKEPQIFWVVTQSFCYLLFITTSSYIIFNLLFKQRRYNEWKQIKMDRARKVIDLVLKNNSVDEVPVIRMLSSFQSQGFPTYFNVLFKVGLRHYLATTDSDALELIEVKEIFPTTPSPTSSNK